MYKKKFEITISEKVKLTQITIFEYLPNTLGEKKLVLGGINVVFSSSYFSSLSLEVSLDQVYIKFL